MPASLIDDFRVSGPFVRSLGSSPEHTDNHLAPGEAGALGEADEQGASSEVTMVSEVSGTHGLAVLVTLAVVVTVGVLVTVRSSRPKNR